MAASSARLIVNRASYHARREEVAAAGGHPAERRGREDLRYATAAWRRYLAALPRADRPRPAVRARGRAASSARSSARATPPSCAGRRASTACACARRRSACKRGRGPRVSPPAPTVPCRRALAAHGHAHRGFPPAAARPRLPSSRRARLRGSRRWSRRSTSAGLYVPGGAGAYPSSVLMNAIPARVAGVPRSLVATPPRALEASPAVAAAIVDRRAGGPRVPRGRRPGRRRSRLRHADGARGREDRRARQRLRRGGQAAGARARGDRPRGGPERGRDPGRRDRGSGLGGRRPARPGRARQRRGDGRAGHDLGGAGRGDGAPRRAGGEQRREPRRRAARPAPGTARSCSWTAWTRASPPSTSWLPSTPR